MEKIKILMKMLKKAKNIVVMTGAGFSTSSGIPDFRSENGLYNEESDVSPEEILSHHFFMENPQKFYQYYFKKMVYPYAKPNVGHKFLADLEKIKNLTIITQNIDGLHQQGGSKNVLELHGSVLENYCLNCGKKYSLQEILNHNLPLCFCGGIIKPEVVLYEEPLNMDVLDKAIAQIVKADLLLIVGSSMKVSPASSLPFYFRGSDIVIINLTSTPFDKYASLIINERCEDIFKKINWEELKDE